MSQGNSFFGKLYLTTGICVVLVSIMQWFLRICVIICLCHHCVFFAASTPLEEAERVLDSEVKRLRSRAYAETTESTYISQLQSYLKFCEHMQYQAVPISPDNLCCYSAWLSLKLHPTSVKQYLNVVRLLHLESGFQNPLAGNWILKTTERH